MNPKRPPIRDKAHLKFIASLPCVKCANPETCAAHIRTETDGGMGMKPSDSWTVPLCHKCHTEQHNKGETTFWGSIKAAKQLARNLYLMKGFTDEDDLMGAQLIIAKARNELWG